VPKVLGETKPLRTLDVVIARRGYFAENAS